MKKTYDVEADINPTDIDNPLAAMQPDEKILCEIKRHPIGMISQYVMVGFVLVLLAAAVAFVPQFLSQSSQSSPSRMQEAALIIWVLVAIISMIGLWISSTIYYKNRWIITSDSITQVNQTGSFDTQMSQLSMANLQDIGVVQDGILPQMFNYGILRAETAGERSKFIFPYCPDPKHYARQILIAREDFINDSPETAKRGNDDLAVPRKKPSDGLNLR